MDIKWQRLEGQSQGLADLVLGEALLGKIREEPGLRGPRLTQMLQDSSLLRGIGLDTRVNVCDIGRGDIEGAEVLPEPRLFEVIAEQERSIPIHRVDLLVTTPQPLDVSLPDEEAALSMIANQPDPQLAPLA